MSNYEQLKRARSMKAVRLRAEGAGITLRSPGVGWAAMVGTDEFGNVWVWDELTQEVHTVGTVDLGSLPPEPTKRGRSVSRG